MDLKDIKKIMQMITDHDISEFKLEEDKFKLEVTRLKQQETMTVAAQPPLVMPHVSMPAMSHLPGAPFQEQPAKDTSVDEGLVEIKAPIVGTFYRAPAPDADAYINVGDEVDENTTVCIVEAMKVMNEIKAELRGVVRKILVDNATPVQFNQPLFLIDPR